MINLTHLKVLLKKDFISLWRSKGFLIGFVMIPFILMYSFYALKGIVDNGPKKGTLLFDNFRYTSTKQQSVQDQTLFGQTIDYGDKSSVSICKSKQTNNYYYTKIAVVAEDPAIREAAQQFFQNYVVPNRLISLDTGLPFEVEALSTQDSIFDIVSTRNQQPYCFFVKFLKFDTDNDQYDVQISFPMNQLPNTQIDSYNPIISSPDLDNYKRWFSSGGADLFPLITEFIARFKTKNPSILNQKTPLFIQTTGYSPLASQEFIDVSQDNIKLMAQNFPIFYMISFGIQYLYITSKISSEKESKAKEGMKMMGLRNTTYYAAWFITYIMISIVTSLIVSAMAITLIFQKVNFFLFFTFSMLYSINMWAWSLIIVAFLPTKRSSGIAAVLFNFISYYLVFIIQDIATPSALQYGMSIVPNVCMTQIIKQLFFYNFQTQQGLNFKTTGIDYQGFSFQNGLILLSFTSIFYSILAIYLDQVIPSEYGVVKPWNFICLCKQKKKLAAIEDFNDEEQDIIKNSRNFEPVSDSLRKQEKNNECLIIKDLKKKFGSKTAVNGVNLKIYNGQIFALLGHNGAGKTTTLSMLTGLIEPYQGKANVFGKNIFENMNEFRMMLGVCPQHDVLFDLLTPEEHLRLFASFKGTDQSIIEDQVQQIIIDIDLVSVKNQISSTLSGGQKRKLSVAIAMIGNSKIVMLDEPSSGMDTTSRRKLWDMLKKNKAGKIIILTTHYMDEADILGDRIGIMAEGVVQCTGSSLFLKNRYGVGYNLIISKVSRDPVPNCDKFILENIKNSKKIQEVSSEISYQLPTESSSQFKNFFSEFDQMLTSLGVRSYGVGITTLEEVFLKIGTGEALKKQELNFNYQQEQQSIDQYRHTEIDLELENYSIVEDGEENQFFQHLYWLILKKFLMQVRDFKTLCIDIILPALLIVAGLKLATIALFQPQTSKILDLSLYPFSNIFYNSDSLYITGSKQIQDFINNDIIIQNSSLLGLSNGVQIQVDQFGNIINDVYHLDKYITQQVQQKQQQILASVYVQSINDPVEGYSSVIFVNSTQQDIVGVWAGVIHQAYLRQFCQDSNLITCKPNIKINFINQPFPLDQYSQGFIKTAAGSNSAILMAISWLMISDQLIQNIVRERDRQIKHQIIISGSSLTAYWLGHYFADILFQSLLSIVSIVGYLVFGIECQDGWIIFILMIFANPSFIYVLSFFFQKEETASLAIKMIYFVIGLIAPLTIAILQLVARKYYDYANMIRWIFYPFPIFSMTFGYMSICNRQTIQVLKQLQQIPDPYSIIIAGPALYFLVAMTFFNWALVILMEMKILDFSKWEQKYQIEMSSNFNESIKNQDQNDVSEEQQRVQNIEPQYLPVRMCNVKKQFGDFTAVKNISFGLEYGECFALLGISGAGKTTLFKCLTGEIYPSQGQLSINGNDITTSDGFNKARKQIGYCPQFDAIFEGLTVLEHLQIYATLKGVKSSIKKKLILQQIIDMDLKDYMHIKANKLSGGNKRKLSVAMAVIGNPPLIFLDEPSTGVDPQAKRFMWDIVSKISTQRKKSAVIITTHSMEEAEALCSKMGIMVDGEFKCFGSSVYIKDKYGTGYELEIKIRQMTEEEILAEILQAKQQNLIPFTFETCQTYLYNTQSTHLLDQISENGERQDFYDQLTQEIQLDPQEFIKWNFAESQGHRILKVMENKFQRFEILEHYGNSWKIKVSRDNYSIGFLFGMMEDLQKEYNISEYSVIQTTLEQIFNNFALQAEKNKKANSLSPKFKNKSPSSINKSPNFKNLEIQYIPQKQDPKSYDFEFKIEDL